VSKKSFYDILGVDKTASDSDIKSTYRKLAMQFHPDRNVGDNQKAAEEKFKEIKEAYDVLRDPQSRAHYDATGNLPHQQPGYSSVPPGDINEILKHMFGGQFTNNPFGDMFNAPHQQHEKIYAINIPLDMAYAGNTVTLDNGAKLVIPKGVRAGARILHDNKTYKINIQQHPKFKRMNDDLLVDVEITAFEAMLGVPVRLTHLDNIEFEFVIPEGIQNQQVVRLAGKGMTNSDYGVTGDLHIRVTVKVPTGLTDDQKEQLKKMPHRNLIKI
jgi:molecular chaperone DnaJ